MVTVNKQAVYKLRSGLRAGYELYTAFNSGIGVMSDQQYAHNDCIANRDLRSIGCELAGWPQNDPANSCYGNNNGKELDRCMSNVWSPEDMDLRREKGGLPYTVYSDAMKTTEYGTKCFNEFLSRHKQKMDVGLNKSEWERCLATIK